MGSGEKEEGVKRRREERGGGGNNRGGVESSERERERAGVISLCVILLSVREVQIPHTPSFPPQLHGNKQENDRRQEEQERSDWRYKHRLSEPQRGGRRSEV